MILVNKKNWWICAFLFLINSRGRFFFLEGPKNWKVYQSLGSPKTKLCPLVVGNPLYESSLKTILCLVLDFQGILRNKFINFG